MAFPVSKTDRRELLGVTYRPETDERGELKPPRMMHQGDVYHHPEAGLTRIEDERKPGTAYHAQAAAFENHQHAWVEVTADDDTRTARRSRRKPASEAKEESKG